MSRSGLVFLFGATCSLLAQHDDIIDSVGRNARIETTLGAGLYGIGANSYAAGETRSYTIRVTTVR